MNPRSVEASIPYEPDLSESEIEMLLGMPFVDDGDYYYEHDASEQGYGAV